MNKLFFAFVVFFAGRNAQAQSGKETGGGTELSMHMFDIGRSMSKILREGHCINSHMDPVELDRAIKTVFANSHSQPHVWDRLGYERSAINGHSDDPKENKNEIVFGEIEMDKIRDDLPWQRVVFAHEITPFMKDKKGHWLKDTGAEISSEFYHCIEKADKESELGSARYHETKRDHIAEGDSKIDKVQSWGRYDLNLPLQGNLTCTDWSDSTEAEIAWPHRESTDSATVWAHFVRTLFPSVFKKDFVFKAQADSKDLHLNCEDIHKKYDHAPYSALYIYTLDQLQEIHPWSQARVSQLVEGHEVCLILRWSNDPLINDNPSPPFEEFKTSIDKFENTEKTIQWISCGFASIPHKIPNWDFKKQTLTGTYERFRNYEQELVFSRENLATKFHPGDEAAYLYWPSIPVLSVGVLLKIREILATGEAQVSWPISDGYTSILPLFELGFPVPYLGDFKVGQTVELAKKDAEPSEGKITRIWSNKVVEVDWHPHEELRVLQLSDIQNKERQ